jgi:hypothetical protein
MKFGVVLYKRLSNKREFRENLFTNSRMLLMDLNEFLSVIATCVLTVFFL